MKIISLFVMVVFAISNVYAQFHTIQKQSKDGYIILDRKPKNYEEEIIKEIEQISISEEQDTISKRERFRLARKKPPRNKNKKEVTYRFIQTNRLEGFTIKKLYQEILDNNIKHPKIVLAQAILETGWFKSSVCRNKGNLFGLTNPRTGEYYEFEHWKESVKAYKTKVQYKFKGGNYLLWLQEIGYAEDPRYVSSLIKILEQHFL